MDSNEPDLFGQLPSVRESHSAKPSCESIGPTSRSTTTSEPSQQIDLEELISSAAGSPASRGPLPGSDEAQKMTAISGQSWLPLLKSYGLNGSLGKMCEDLLARNWASSAVFLTWKASDTAPSHLLFQLAPSMPHTDEIGSGLLHTSTATANQMAPSMRGRDRGSWWQTPVADDACNRKNGKWNSRGEPKLSAQMKMWPTPTAHLHKEGGYPAEYTRNTPTLTAVATESEDKPHSSGSLNPTWVEWLMGFPEGWTDLNP